MWSPSLRAAVSDDGGDREDALSSDARKDDIAFHVLRSFWFHDFRPGLRPTTDGVPGCGLFGALGGFGRVVAFGGLDALPRGMITETPR